MGPPVFIAALFTIANTWKQTECPLTEEWIKKIQYIYTMEHYSAIKRMKQCHLQCHRWTWQLSKANQTKSDRERQIYYNVYVQ